jgi:hypothetical protein
MPLSQGGRQERSARLARTWRRRCLTGQWWASALRSQKSCSGSASAATNLGVVAEAEGVRPTGHGEPPCYPGVVTQRLVVQACGLDRLAVAAGVGPLAEGQPVAQAPRHRGGRSRQLHADIQPPLEWQPRWQRQPDARPQHRHPRTRLSGHALPAPGRRHHAQGWAGLAKLPSLLVSHALIASGSWRTRGPPGFRGRVHTAGMLSGAGPP